MSTKVITNFEPISGNFYIVEDSYVKGGLKTVSTYADISNIPTSSRKVGSLIYVQDEDCYYKFYPNTSTLIKNEKTISNITTLDSPYSADISSKHIIGLANSGNIQINLPSLITSMIGKSIYIKIRLDSNPLYTISVVPHAGNTIDGSGSVSLSPTTGLNSIQILALNTSLWNIISSHKL